MFTVICRPVTFFSLLLIGVLVHAAVKEPLITQARDLYKKGDYAQAADIYERIDQEHKDFLRTREELAWSYLRAGEWTKLRGLLAHLNSKLVPLRWRLEGRVMSAMILLRECQYEKVKEQMALFQKELTPFVQQIEAQAAKSAHSAYWGALRDEVAEAMLKMKFVKMELRSRLVMLGREQVVDAQSTKGSTDKVPAGKQTFPLGEDLWVDEVFLAQGNGTGACKEIHKSKVVQ